jgi:hypothetical protein
MRGVSFSSSPPYVVGGLAAAAVVMCAVSRRMYVQGANDHASGRPHATLGDMFSTSLYEIGYASLAVATLPLWMPCGVAYTWGYRA